MFALVEADKSSHIVFAGHLAKIIEPITRRSSELNVDFVVLHKIIVLQISILSGHHITTPEVLILLLP